MNKCILLGAGEYKNDKIEKNEGDFLICCDGGYDHRGDLKVDLLIGDFDSINDPLPIDIEIKKLNKIKDTTDIFEGIKEGIKRGYKRFYLYGCLGNRIEHSLANIQNLIYLKNKGFEGFLIQNNTTIRVLKNEKLALDSSHKGYFSLFSFSNSSVVTIRNAKYEIDKKVIKNSFPLGIDNEFIGQETEIEISKGTCVLIYNFKDCKN